MYCRYGKKEFEYKLRDFLIKGKLGYMNDITDEWKAENGETWEHIYRISTKNKAVDIILFSSIDRKTGYVREKGDDAVRVVLRWKTGSGYRFKKLHKHLRIKTLFANLEKTISAVIPFNLNVKEFTPIQKIS